MADIHIPPYPYHINLERPIWSKSLKTFSIFSSNCLKRQKREGKTLNSSKSPLLFFSFSEEQKQNPETLVHQYFPHTHKQKEANLQLKIELFKLRFHNVHKYPINKENIRRGAISTSCMKSLLGVTGNPLTEPFSLNPQALLTTRACLARFKRFSVCEFEAINSQIKTRKLHKIEKGIPRI